MSDTVRALTARRNAWPHLADVYQWALHEAIESEYGAAVASDAAQPRIHPVYPTIVHLLACVPWTDDTCPSCDSDGATSCPD